MYDSHRFCVAPMMDCTDRHYRYLARLMTKHSRLYTEMVTTGALLYGDHERYLNFNSCEHPIALQLGGNDASEMARCTEYAAKYAFDEVNINAGCPSDRVQAGKFGACLIREPKTVANCIKTMSKVADIEITVKTRIGVDELDSYENLSNFVKIIADAGCNTFIIHARKAYLLGLSPKQNRTVPPLRYEYVYQLKQEYPQLKLILNGGLDNLNEIHNHLVQLDGVMIGRKAYDDLYFLANVDTEIFGSEDKSISRYEILNKYLMYAQEQLSLGVPLSILMRPTFGLFNGISGAKAWRRFLSENIHKMNTDINVICQAASEMEQTRKISMLN